MKKTIYKDDNITTTKIKRFILLLPVYCYVQHFVVWITQKKKNTIQEEPMTK